MSKTRKKPKERRAKWVAQACVLVPQGLAVMYKTDEIKELYSVGIGFRNFFPRLADFTEFFSHENTCTWIRKGKAFDRCVEPLSSLSITSYGRITMSPQPTMLLPHGLKPLKDITVLLTFLRKPEKDVAFELLTLQGI